MHSRAQRRHTAKTEPRLPRPANDTARPAVLRARFAATKDRLAANSNRLTSNPHLHTFRGRNHRGRPASAFITHTLTNKTQHRRTFMRTLLSVFHAAAAVVLMAGAVIPASAQSDEQRLAEAKAQTASYLRYFKF